MIIRIWEIDVGDGKIGRQDLSCVIKLNHQTQLLTKGFTMISTSLGGLRSVPQHLIQLVPFFILYLWKNSSTGGELII